MDESVIEITPEERERIIANIKSNGALFVGSRVAKAIQANYNNNKECWNKLLALIESAPAKKNMRAVELADKLEAAYKDEECKGDMFSAIGKTLDYDWTRTTAKEDFYKLLEAIRNLDAPEDGMQWPLDRDGVPIKPGDTVYYQCRSDEDFIVRKIIIAENESSKKELSIEIVGVSEDKNRGYCVSPNEVTHNKSRTLNGIIQEANIQNMSLEDMLDDYLVLNDCDNISCIDCEEITEQYVVPDTTLDIYQSSCDFNKKAIEAIVQEIKRRIGDQKGAE